MPVRAWRQGPEVQWEWHMPSTEGSDTSRGRHRVIANLPWGAGEAPPIGVEQGRELTDAGGRAGGATVSEGSSYSPPAVCRGANGKGIACRVARRPRGLAPS